jgi:AcrR family transcriptional regulator
MAEIAEGTGFAVGTLYVLFKDKNAIYGQLLEAAVGEFERALIAALTDAGDEVRKIERYIETMAALFVKHRSLARIYFGQTSRAAATPMVGGDPNVQATQDQLLALLKSTLSAGMRKGLFLEMDPELCAYGLGGLCTAYLAKLIEQPDDLTAEMMAGATKTIFFEQMRLGTANT